ncbi:MAG TPA: hypothetical protein PLC35_03415 [Methanosarcina vacuolata]|nr:hypothetical protein [Methanosarcina vacuolata]
MTQDKIDTEEENGKVFLPQAMIHLSSSEILHLGIGILPSDDALLTSAFCAAVRNDDRGPSRHAFTRTAWPCVNITMHLSST